MSEYIPHNQRPGEKAIAFLILLIITCGMLSCCSPKARAYRKLERAKEIAPELFELDTVRELLIADPPRANFDFDCLELEQGELNIEVPREYVFDGEVVRDTVRIYLSEEGSGVDCPPIEKEIVYQDVPVPVEKPLSKWQEIKIAFPYILWFSVTIGLILLFIRIVKWISNITRLKI